MPLEDLWKQYRTHGLGSLKPEGSALDHFYVALLAFGEADFAQALHQAQAAVHMEPDNAVFEQAALYLERVAERGKENVYVDGEAFRLFVRGGGNVGLYEAVSDALNTTYQQYETLRLLDIGVGDGMALLPALTQNIVRLDLVEPSEAMLNRTTQQLARWNIDFYTYQERVQSFIRTAEGEWDLIQATWSLQSVPPEERPAILKWARAHGQRLLIAEFDVPNFPELYAPDRVRHIVARYWDGLGEYADDGGVVAQGFLMPVMFGYFDRSAARTNWEGPIQEWVDMLRAAGFEQVERRELYDYWWARATLIDAQ